MAKERNDDAPSENLLEGLQKTVQEMHDKRQGMVDRIKEIDRGLEAVRATIDKLLGNKARADRVTRSAGKQSGTKVIESILSEHKGEMSSSECAALAMECGVKYPHSSYQSLKKRGRIELDNGVIRLVK